MILHSTVTCPACGRRSVEAMPVDACQYVYVCPHCHARLTPLAGCCCIYCSYGDVPCPPVQEADSPGVCCGKKS